MADLHVTERGVGGTRVVLVHGSLSDGNETWAGQYALADQGYHLVIPDRRGYGRSPREGGEDYERDAADIAPLLGDGAHLVGHSYGGLAALWAATLRPEAVRSLTVIEPPAFRLLPDDEVVASYMSVFKQLWAHAELSDREFLEQFLTSLGMPPEEVTASVLDAWEPATSTLRNGRAVWDASVPTDILNAVLFPKLVLSGNHHAAFEAVCDALAAATGARRVVLSGAGHEVQALTEPFNQTVLEFWRAAEAAEAGAVDAGVV